jgi:uncharacterized BrkB/YihY/UPF0761 family membrane protein
VSKRYLTIKRYPTNKVHTVYENPTIKQIMFLLTGLAFMFGVMFMVINDINKVRASSAILHHTTLKQEANKSIDSYAEKLVPMQKAPVVSKRVSDNTRKEEVKVLNFFVVCFMVVYFLVGLGFILYYYIKPPEDVN